ncbi:hypothetical protein HanPSC8_Chr15g0653521 [Helianthus annuus]|nr:hypothetical protein HanPSC8_Chr15g0653521 [Helianthus annuus]
MAIKLKPQGPRCKKFEFWTKGAKLTKPQGPKWQFTLQHEALHGKNVNNCNSSVNLLQGTSALCISTLHTIHNPLRTLTKTVTPNLFRRLHGGDTPITMLSRGVPTATTTAYNDVIKETARSITNSRSIDSVSIRRRNNGNLSTVNKQQRSKFSNI